MTRKLFMHFCVYIMEDFGNHWLFFLLIKKIKKILKLDKIQGSKTGRWWATVLGRCFDQFFFFFLEERGFMDQIYKGLRKSCE